MNKSIALLLAGISTAFILYCSTPSAAGQSVPGKIYSVVEEQPEFPGGSTALSRYLADNIKFPGSLMRQGTDTGPVSAQFVVERDGSIHDVRITTKSLTGNRKVRKGMEDFMTTVIATVEKMPNWKPGKINNRAVAVLYTLPIEVNMQ